MKTARRVLIAAVLLALGACLVAGALGVEPFARWLGALGVLGAAALAGLAAKKKAAPDVEKIKENAREKVLAQDPTAVVAGLDDRARASIDAAKQAGVDAGIDAATAYLHRGAGSGGDKGSGSGGSR
jgi:hypothetical protein